MLARHYWIKRRNTGNLLTVGKFFFAPYFVTPGSWGNLEPKFRPY